MPTSIQNLLVITKNEVIVRLKEIFIVWISHVSSDVSTCACVLSGPCPSALCSLYYIYKGFKIKGCIKHMKILCTLVSTSARDPHNVPSAWSFTTVIWVSCQDALVPLDIIIISIFSYHCLLTLCWATLSFTYSTNQGIQPLLLLEAHYFFFHLVNGCELPSSLRYKDIIPENTDHGPNS